MGHFIWSNLRTRLSRDKEWFLSTRITEGFVVDSFAKHMTLCSLELLEFGLTELQSKSSKLAEHIANDDLCRNVLQVKWVVLSGAT